MEEKFDKYYSFYHKISVLISKSQAIAWVFCLILIESCNQGGLISSDKSSENIDAYLIRAKGISRSNPDSALLLLDTVFAFMTEAEASPLQLVNYYTNKSLVFRELNNKDQELKILFEAKAIALEYPDLPYLEALVNLNLANYYNFYYQPDFAKFYAEEAHQFFQKHKDYREYTESLFELSEVYLAKENYLKTIFHLQEGIADTRLRNDTLSWVMALSDLSYSLNEQGLYQKGLEFTRGAIGLIKSNTNPGRFYADLANLAINYKYLYPDSAKHYLKEGIKRASENSDSMSLIISKYNLANRLNELYDMDEAEKLFLEVKDYCERNEVEMGLCLSSYGLGSVEVNRKNNKTAIQFLRESLNAAEEQSLDFMIFTCWEALESTYRVSGDLIMADQFRLKFDSINNLKQRANINQLMEFSQMASAAEQEFYKNISIKRQKRGLEELAAMQKIIWIIALGFLMIYLSIQYTILKNRQGRSSAVNALIKKYKEELSDKTYEPDRTNSIHPNWVGELYNLFEKEKIYLDPGLKVDYVLQVLGISYRQLNDYLKTSLQTNFPQFVNQYRLNEAKKYLADDSNSSLSLSELALEFGFGTRQSFHNSFLKEFGITPSEFRKAVKFKHGTMQDTKVVILKNYLLKIRLHINLGSLCVLFSILAALATNTLSCSKTTKIKSYDSAEVNAYMDRIRELNDAHPDSALLLADTLERLLDPSKNSTKQEIEFHLLKATILKKLTKSEDELNTLLLARSIAAEFPEDSLTVARVNLALAGYFNNQYQPDFGIPYAEEAFQYFKENPQNNEYAKSLNQLSKIYFLKNKYLETTYLLQEAINSSNLRKDTMSLVAALSDLGYYMNIQGQYEEGIKYTRDALSLIQSNSQPNKYYRQFTNLAINYKFLYPDSSLYFQEESIKIGSQKSDSLNIIMAKYNYANLLVELKEDDKAEKIFNEVKDYCKRKNVGQGLPLASYGLGEVEESRGNYLKAINHFQKARELASELGLDFWMENIFEALAISYAASNQIQMAEHFRLQFDSINAVKLQNQIAELQKFSKIASMANQEISQNILLKEQKEDIEEVASLLQLLWAILLAIFMTFIGILLRIITVRQERNFAVGKLIEKYKKEEKNREISLIPKAKDIPQWVEKFYQLLEKKQIYLNPDLRIEEVLQSLDVNYQQFNNYIKGSQWISFSSLVNQYRVNHAKALLSKDKNNLLSMEEIARGSGFGTRQSFHSTFSKVVGITPSEFRKVGKSFAKV